MKTVSYENLYIRDPKTGETTPFMAIRGESAYDIAVKLGTFTGTEEEWNNYIKTERNAALAAIDAKLRAALEIIPDDLEELHAQIDSLGRIQISSAEPSDPSVDLWVDTDDNEEIVVVTADDIAQELGDAEDKVLSQKAAKEWFDKISEDIDDLTDTVTEEIFVTVEFDSVEDGKAYSTQTPAGGTVSGYNTYNKTVSAGETLYINTTVVPVHGYSVCVFYNKGSYVTVDGQYPTYSGEVSRYEVVIPDGVDTLKITAATSAAVSIERKERGRSFLTKEEGREIFDAVNKFSAKMYVSLSDDILNVVTKYTKTHDMRVRFGKRGVNRLPDFVSLGLIANTSAVPSENVDNVEIFLNPGSDWFAPYILQAKGNADGDLPEGYASHFTGGNHEYTNTGSGGTATARCAVLRYFIDGRESEVYRGYASKVEIRWTNYVQGNNTKKVDGTGREILQENHTMVFDGTDWNVDVDLIPLEDILVKTWYGFQICGLSSSRYSKIKYINGKNRAENAVTASSVSGNNICDGMVAFGDTHKVICEIDSQYDLGKREFYSGNQGAFAMTYGKAYFTVIQGSETFAANNHYYLRGKYKFEQMP